MPIRPLTYPDISPVARLLAAAFKETAITGQFCHPYREQYPEGMYLLFLRHVREQYRKASPENVLLVSCPAGKEQTVTGFAHWYRKRPVPLTRAWPNYLSIKAVQTYNYLESLIYPNRALDPERFAALRGIDPFISHHWTGSRADVWHLELLGVAPAYGGRGIGGELIAWGFEKAGSESLGCSVSAAVGTEGFYRRNGFVVEAGNVKDEGGEANPFVRFGLVGGTVMFSR
ncbi:hypothetical protein LTR10_000175 [Elasticomyces elasticus]|nr:hypothetical protein LTR10_000175 [Elasticomyces elasticus]KAK4980566.1 hypothetical protein LTR42_000874 [Elasticomyces elasticus]